MYVLLLYYDADTSNQVMLYSFLVKYLYTLQYDRYLGL
jgi:hypothetical protein